MIPRCKSLSMVGRMPKLSPTCSCSTSPLLYSTSTVPLIRTLQLSSSSPSVRTTIPARSTTANTMTAHSARLTARVMFVKALRCCVNSRRTSMSSSDLSTGSFSRHSLTVSRTVKLCKINTPILIFTYNFHVFCRGE